MLITKLARERVAALLRERWATTATSACTEHEVAPGALDVDFESGFQFFLGDFTPEDLDERSDVRYPIMTLSARNPRVTRDGDKPMFGAPFVGEVDVELAVWISWEEARYEPRMEAEIEALEAALVVLFNEPVYSMSLLNGGGLSYHGDLSCERTSLVQETNNWRQGVIARARMVVGNC